MPLYEYKCDAGHRFELIRRFSDPPLETCPTCGAPVKKLFSSPAIQFKGSGFYITDYAKKSSSSDAGSKSSGGDGSSPSSGDSKSSESKSTDSSAKSDTKSDKKS